jgi:hypothetical protein
MTGNPGRLLTLRIPPADHAVYSAEARRRFFGLQRRVPPRVVLLFESGGLVDGDEAMRAATVIKDMSDNQPLVNGISLFAEGGQLELVDLADFRRAHNRRRWSWKGQGVDLLLIDNTTKWYVRRSRDMSRFARVCGARTVATIESDGWLQRWGEPHGRR